VYPFTFNGNVLCSAHRLKVGLHSTIYGAEQGIKERVMKPIYLVVTETGELVRDVNSEIASLPMRNTLLEQL
jgi:hypothetical protein